MDKECNATKITTGGEFLVKNVQAENIYIPEEINEEQQMIVQTCKDFLNAEIYPILDRIDSQEKGLMKSLLAKSGELGLLGIAVPEEYEGFDQSFLTTMIANETIGAGHSFSVAYMAHTGIGTLPILYYGNEEQKQKYIPNLTSGDWAAAYCLTEPNAGSDANSGKTAAVLSEDGKHYILNGQKMWITNGGFADVLTVFAKIDNDRVLSAFIVESDSEGITINPEEKKMGIKGSSTTQIFLNDVKVPVENLLGKRGEGFRIALNILHLGRIKLGANAIGSSKRAITHSVNYANERKQFGTLISSFGAIKYKLAEQVIRVFAIESATYRASKNIDDKIHDLISQGVEKGKAHIDGSACFAVECALLKVLGSDVLDYVVDETVQIFGGMGFSAEANADRIYRDSRINRIFEGTNEINRLLVVDTAIKTAQKKEYNLFGPAEEVMKNITNLKPILNGDESYFEEKAKIIQGLKNAVLMTIKSMSDAFNKKLVQEQEVMMNVSDMIIYLYAAESTMLRVQKSEILSGEENSLFRDILNVFVFDATANINKFGSEAICCFGDNIDIDQLLKALQHFTTVAPVNVKNARRNIANKLIDDNRYNF